MTDHRRQVGAPGLIISAPASRSGKTTISLAVTRALANCGLMVSPFKIGPDYIDPAYLSAAARHPARNLDSWAMSSLQIATVAADGSAGADISILEGALGLFDGAIGVPEGEPDGSAADLAATLGLPVVLVVPVRGQGASVAALVRGFVNHRADVDIAGVILNNVGSSRHETALRTAIARTTPEIPVLGALPEADGLRLPERHLGLVQAREHPDIERYLEGAAHLIENHVDLDALAGLARKPGVAQATSEISLLPPPGNRVAVARDDAFAFAYRSLLDGWRRAGAEISFFSPLADEGPATDCDSVYLPGGYPELHAARLAETSVFFSGLRRAAERGATIFGECGGYMVLGRTLTDAAGNVHRMADLLPMESSFATTRRSLGYRQVELLESGWLGPRGTRLRGHEFHYATSTSLLDAPVFGLRSAAGESLPNAGHRIGNVWGSFIHLISRRTP